METNATEEEHGWGLDIADYFLKWDLINEENAYLPKPYISEQNKEPDSITFDEYTRGLCYENKNLLNGYGYPAEWDLTETDIDQKTKNFIKIAARNPVLLQFREHFNLSLIT